MSPQAGWILQEEIVPRLRSAVPYAVRPVGCEDAQELVQDATAMAARLLESVERAGKQVKAGNIAYYAIRLVKSGRRSTWSSKVDVHAAGTQLNGHTRLSSLEEPAGFGEDGGGESFTFNDVLSADQDDPAMAAARKLDWETLRGALSETGRQVLHCLLEGRDLTTLVDKLKRSRSALQKDKERLAGLVREYLGADILAQVQAMPRWMDNLAANRERLACRAERQAA
jgi:hypothetical protein